VSERVSMVKYPMRHITGHFGDKSFQAIDCTGTDNQKQGNTRISSGDEIPERDITLFCYLSAFNDPNGGVPLGDLCKILCRG